MLGFGNLFSLSSVGLYWSLRYLASLASVGLCWRLENLASLASVGFSSYSVALPFGVRMV